MYESIKRIYAKTQDSKLVENAVKKNWITQEEANEITERA